MDSEQQEWMEIFKNWPNTAQEAYQRLQTRNGLPNISLPVTQKNGPPIALPLRSILWKHYILHPSSALTSVLPPGITSESRRQAFYQQLLSRKNESQVIMQIQKDVGRSAPYEEHIQFMTPEKTQALERILIAYSIYDKDLGYCQGLNFVAMIFLMQLKESDAFWGLLVFLNGFNIRNLYSTHSNLLQQFLDLLTRELSIRFPKLLNHLTDQGITVTLYSMEWLTTFFVPNFPLSTLLRIWDILLAKGYQGGAEALYWLYQVSMAIHQVCHDQFLDWDIDNFMTKVKELTMEIHPHVLLSRAIDFYPSDSLKQQLTAVLTPQTNKCMIRERKKRKPVSVKKKKKKKI